MNALAAAFDLKRRLILPDGSTAVFPDGPSRSGTSHLFGRFLGRFFLALGRFLPVL